MALIGIDLGTTHSLVSVWKDNQSILIPNSFGELLTPSVVSLDDNGSILIGKIAKQRLISHPDKTVSNFKQFMGTAKLYHFAEKELRPEDLSALVLRQLKEDAQLYLGEEVTEAIISVPAYFSDSQRTATKNAGSIAGLLVERIINEPSAAAIAYQHQLGNDGTYVILDLGGGTLDISIVEMFNNVVDIIAVSGDNQLGGNDIDQMILDEFFRLHPGLSTQLSAPEKSALLKTAEQCKKTLSELPAALMVFTHNTESYSMELTNQKLAQICTPLLAKMQEVLKHALKDSSCFIQNINQVILVGGSCRMPLVKEYVKHLTGKNPLSNLDPDKIVAQGIGIVTGIKNRDTEIKDMVLTDICPFTLGIAVQNTNQPGRYLYSPIINRNTALPSSRMDTYTNVRDNQKQLSIDIYQGESMYVEENLLLGKILLPIPELPEGQALVQVRFTYDINGILEVDAHCPQNGQSQKELIISNNNLTKQEIEQRLAVLESLKTPPREQDENRLLLAWGESLYQEASNNTRNILSLVLSQFETILETRSPARIEKERARLTKLFTDLEHYQDSLTDFSRYFPTDTDYDDEPNC